MIIPIDKEIHIREIPECWQLEKSIIHNAKRDWVAFKSFKSLPDALQSIDKIAARYSNILDDALASKGVA